MWDYLLVEDLQMLQEQGDDFKLFARPEGSRCLVMSGRGVTIARDQRGLVVAKFQSGLPGGNPEAGSDADN